MKQSREYLKKLVENREKGNYRQEDMTEDENYDPSKIYWSCFSETPEGCECILVYAFDRQTAGEVCPCEDCFDNADFAFGSIPCSSWK